MWLQGKGGGSRADHSVVVGEGGDHPVSAFLIPRHSTVSVWIGMTANQNPGVEGLQAQEGLQ